MRNNNIKTNVQTGQRLNLTDLFFYLLSHWPWYVISIALCCALAYYNCARTPLTYSCSATVIIKDPSQSNSVGLDRFENYINRVNVANELLQFRSVTLMTEVVERMHADISYKEKSGLRMTELYTFAPVRLTLADVLPERAFRLTVTPIDSATFEVSDLAGLPGAEAAYRLHPGDSIVVGGERLRFDITDHYTAAWAGKPLFISKMPLSDAAIGFLNSINIRQAEDQASILTITMHDNSPRRAEDMINTLVAIYNETAIRDKNQVSVNTARFIDERLRIIEGELGHVESDLESFKQANQLLDVEPTATRYINKAERFNEDIVALETQLKWAQMVKANIENPAKQRDLIPTSTGLADGSIEREIVQHNNIKLKRDRLAEESGENNPVIEEMDNALHALRQSIARSVDNLMTNLAIRRDDAVLRERQSQSNFTTMPTKERQMLGIERQQKIKESLYLFLLNKREENALTQAMADNNARMIDNARSGRVAMLPQPRKTMGLGLLAGLALPTLLFLARLFMDSKVRSRRDMEEALSIPFLGEVPFDPQVARQKRKGHHWSVSAQGDDMVTEALRILRTNMTFMKHDGRRTQVITFTSFNEGAGKTFLSRNLALSLAFTKKRVVVVDLDIRKGTLSRSLRQHGVGVTDYLANTDIRPEDIIRRGDEIDVVPSGTVAPNPAELLMDKRLDELFDHLRQAYDYVFVDNVPVGIVADATIASRVADLTIFVARAGRIDRRQLPDIESLYTEHKLGDNMAIVLNGADTSHRYGYYRYGYGNYGYGYYRYGYGYGHKHKNKKWWLKLWQR